MEVFIFARFHAREGHEEAVAAALRDVVVPTRAEPGCLAINAFRSIRDPSLFHLHSRWTEETAFDIHAELPHRRKASDTVRPIAARTVAASSLTRSSMRARTTVLVIGFSLSYNVAHRRMIFQDTE